MIKGTISSTEQKSETVKFYLTEPEQNPQTKTNENPINASAQELPKKKEEEPLIIPFTNGKQILELLNQIEEKNLYYIQNSHESKEDLDKKQAELKILKEEHETQTKDHNERIRLLKNAKNVDNI